jgi:hypothetical protein
MYNKATISYFDWRFVESNRNNTIINTTTQVNKQTEPFSFVVDKAPSVLKKGITHYDEETNMIRVHIGDKWIELDYNRFESAILKASKQNIYDDLEETLNDRK